MNDYRPPAGRVPNDRDDYLEPYDPYQGSRITLTHYERPPRIEPVA